MIIIDNKPELIYSLEYLEEFSDDMSEFSDDIYIGFKTDTIPLKILYIKFSIYDVEYYKINEIVYDKEFVKCILEK